MTAEQIHIFDHNICNTFVSAKKSILSDYDFYKIDQYINRNHLIVSADLNIVSAEEVINFYNTCKRNLPNDNTIKLYKSSYLNTKNHQFINYNFSLFAANIPTFLKLVNFPEWYHSIYGFNKNTKVDIMYDIDTYMSIISGMTTINEHE